jgi:hypothetical protein
VRVHTDELRLKMAALDTDTLRRIAAASGDEYTPEARDAARVALSSRSTELDLTNATPPGPPTWRDSVPPRIHGLLPIYTIIALGATVLVVIAAFITWYADAGPGVAFTIQMCLTAGVAWAIAIGIRQEHAHVRVSIFATYLAFAAAIAIDAVTGDWDGLIFAGLVLWLAAGLWRDPEVTR